MYSSEFTPKPLSKVNAIRPVERRALDAKFEGNTTYGGDYRKWTGERTQPIRAQSGYEPPNMPFEGMSTYKGTLLLVDFRFISLIIFIRSLHSSCCWSTTII
jgi:hypothetical protein